MQDHKTQVDRGDIRRLRGFGAVTGVTLCDKLRTSERERERERQEVTCFKEVVMLPMPMILGDCLESNAVRV